MPPIPTLTGSDVVKIFTKLGWTVKRQKGSHVIMTKPGSMSTLSIPQHNPLAKGTLRSLIRAANITPEEFLRER
jgi:predicted RNA binding protein YcfA (HicA-like mRNA interferase family)